jgi:TolB-like protein
VWFVVESSLLFVFVRGKNLKLKLLAPLAKILTISVIHNKLNEAGHGREGRGSSRLIITMRSILMKKAVMCVIIACFIPAIAFSQSAFTIDAALSNSTTYFSGRLPADTKVLVLNCTSKWPDLSDYIIEELIGYIVNEGKLAVVDRQNLETIRKEMDFQLSGEVSDETAQSIGKKLGAQTIMTGSITAIGNAYRLRVRAISVETAQILGMQNVDVVQDGRLAALTGTAYSGPAVAAAAAAPRAATTTTSNTTPAVTVAPANTNYVNLAAAEWKIGVDSKSLMRFSVNKEIIEGRESEVINLVGTLSSLTSRWAIVFTQDTSIAQKLARGSGVRFKVLGDGKRWELRIHTKEASADSAWYNEAINTQKDKVVTIDTPYSRLKQPASWGKKVPFNKNSIMGMSFGINTDTQGTVSSNIKIFDLEIY